MPRAIIEQRLSLQTSSIPLSRKARCASEPPASSKVMGSRKRSSQQAKKLPGSHALSACRASFSRRMNPNQEGTCLITEGHLVHGLSRTRPVLIAYHLSRVTTLRFLNPDKVLSFWCISLGPMWSWPRRCKRRPKTLPDTISKRIQQLRRHQSYMSWISSTIVLGRGTSGLETDEMRHAEKRLL